MQQDLNRVIEQVSKEKGIDKAILISALENAMISAAKKTFGHQRKIEAQFNPEIGEVELFEAKTVVRDSSGRSHGNYLGRTPKITSIPMLRSAMSCCAN